MRCGCYGIAIAWSLLLGLVAFILRHPSVDLLIAGLFAVPGSIGCLAIAPARSRAPDVFGRTEGKARFTKHVVPIRLTYPNSEQSPRGEGIMVASVAKPSLQGDW